MIMKFTPATTFYEIYPDAPKILAGYFHITIKGPEAEYTGKLRPGYYRNIELYKIYRNAFRGSQDFNHITFKGAEREFTHVPCPEYCSSNTFVNLELKDAHTVSKINNIGNKLLSYSSSEVLSIMADINKYKAELNCIRRDMVAFINGFSDVYLLPCEYEPFSFNSTGKPNSIKTITVADDHYDTYNDPLSSDVRLE